MSQKFGPLKMQENIVTLDDGNRYYQRTLGRDFALFLFGDMRKYYPTEDWYHGEMSAVAIEVLTETNTERFFYIHQYNLKEETFYYVPVDPNRFSIDCNILGGVMLYVPRTVIINGEKFPENYFKICNPRQILTYMGAYLMDVPRYREIGKRKITESGNTGAIFQILEDDANASKILKMEVNADRVERITGREKDLTVGRLQRKTAKGFEREFERGTEYSALLHNPVFAALTSKLDYETIEALCKTDERFAIKCRDERFWRQIYERDVPETYSDMWKTESVDGVEIPYGMGVWTSKIESLVSTRLLDWKKYSRQKLSFRTKIQMVRKINAIGNIMTDIFMPNRVYPIRYTPSEHFQMERKGRSVNSLTIRFQSDNDPVLIIFTFSDTKFAEEVECTRRVIGMRYDDFYTFLGLFQQMLKHVIVATDVPADTNSDDWTVTYLQVRVRSLTISITLILVRIVQLYGTFEFSVQYRE